LDGLDEVPGSANRIEVVRLVNDLLIDVTSESGDVLVIVTTRRQGYKDDFPQEQFRHWYLTPLSTARALHCAQRFASVHMGEADRERVMTHLATAATAEDTARLMRSPLQVTIMATLAQSGSIPDDRWRLFSEYYRIIYEREVAKRTWKVLETNREDIRVIHDRVALVLQMECEHIGQTDARLTSARLESIVKRRLSEQRFSETDVAQLTHKILEAASERLVFLVGVEAGRVGFEIRSLQEFMAARSLLHGNDESVIKRLQHIAAIPHWRNTFMFAAAYCFSERDWLGDTITGVCTRLNQPANDPIAARALAGSQLALDLIEVGAAVRQPKFRAVLNANAIDLLKRPPSDLQHRLASISGLESELQNRIRAWLQQGYNPAQLPAWMALTSLVARGVPGATALADSYWPQSVKQQMAVLGLSPSNDPWTVNKTTRCFLDSPLQIHSWLIQRPGRTPHPLQKALCQTPREITQYKDAKGLGLMLTPSRSAEWQKVSESEIQDLHARAFFGAVRRFARSPSPRHLAESLSRTRPILERLRRWISSFPWPIAAALSKCSTAEDVERQVQKARAGALGTAEDWDSAEDRWDRGFEIQDIVAFIQHGAEIGSYLRHTGVPFNVASFSFSARGITAFSSTLWRSVWRGHEINRSGVNDSERREGRRSARRRFG
jgi:hypothetical protein